MSNFLKCFSLLSLAVICFLFFSCRNEFDDIIIDTTPNPIDTTMTGNPTDTTGTNTDTTTTGMDTTMVNMNGFMFIDCQESSSTDCDIKGDWFWLNFQTNPPLYSTRGNLKNQLRFLDGGIGSFFPSDKNFFYEVNSNCTEITFRNQITSEVISNHKIVSITDDVLIYEDAQNCIDGNCIFIRSNGFPSKFDEYEDITVLNAECDIDKENLECECPSSSFGNKCANSNLFVDFTGEEMLVDSKFTNDDNILLLTSSSVQNTNWKTLLIKTTLEGDVIWSNEIHTDFTFDNELKTQTYLAEDAQSNIYVIIPESKLNTNTNLILKIFDSNGTEINSSNMPIQSFNQRTNLSMHLADNSLFVVESSRNTIHKLDLNGNILKSVNIDLQFPLENFAVYDDFICIFHSEDWGLNATTFNFNLDKIEDSYIISSELDAVSSSRIESMSGFTMSNNKCYIAIDTEADRDVNASDYMNNIIGIVIDANLSIVDYIKAPIASTSQPEGTIRFVTDNKLVFIGRDRTSSTPFFTLHDENLNFEFLYNLPDNEDFARFDCYDAKQIGDKIYFVGDGDRFGRNILIKRFDYISLYHYDYCN